MLKLLTALEGVTTFTLGCFTSPTVTFPKILQLSSVTSTLLPNKYDGVLEESSIIPIPSL